MFAFEQIFAFSVIRPYYFYFLHLKGESVLYFIFQSFLVLFNIEKVGNRIFKFGNQNMRF